MKKRLAIILIAALFSTNILAQATNPEQQKAYTELTSRMQARVYQLYWQYLPLMMQNNTDARDGKEFQEQLAPIQKAYQDTMYMILYDWENYKAGRYRVPASRQEPGNPAAVSQSTAASAGIPATGQQAGHSPGAETQTPQVASLSVLRGLPDGEAASGSPGTPMSVNFMGVNVPLPIYTEGVVSSPSAVQNDPLIRGLRENYAATAFSGGLQQKKTAAELGEARAQAELSMAYYRESDYLNAMTWAKKSADQGNGIGLFLLGVMNRQGYATDKDESAAQALFARALPALQLQAEYGIAEAQLCLYFMHRSGLGVEKNGAAAMSWLEKAGQKGNSQAMIHMGEQYIRGELVPANPAVGKQWLQKAADAGDAEGLLKLGEFYSKRIAGQPDPNLARETYLKAAQTGSPQGIETLANLCYEGNLFPRDYSKAVALYNIAAKNGSSRAMKDLAYMYVKGLGVIKNKNVAYKWYFRSAQHGNARALYNLAIMYSYGNGALKNKEKGMALLQAAIERGDEKAAEEYQWQLRVQNCKFCDEDGYTTCQTCGGRGETRGSPFPELEMWQDNTCTACDGSGITKCSHDAAGRVLQLFFGN